MAILVPLGMVITAQDDTVDSFFRNFSDEWVRANPNLATSTRYFIGDEQHRLERQMTPQSDWFPHSLSAQLPLRI